MIVRDKNQECWKEFCKDTRQKDAWEVVRWVKDPWRIKAVMKPLWDTDNNPLNTDKERAEGLIRDCFV